MHQIVVSDVQVDIVRKDIKNLHLAVYPPNGRVRVAVPLYVDDDAVRLAVVSRLAWIKRQQVQFSQQDRQTLRQYISGESHYFQGTRYLLNVIFSEETPNVKIHNKKYLDLVVRLDSDAQQRHRVLLNWYRQQLKQEAEPLVTIWQKRISVYITDWRIKQMKTKWGTCNMEARRVWLNLELAKKPTRCLEYIVVHELVHLLERHHNEKFTGLMDHYLPSWRHLRDELNKSPLAHENWTY